jgi:hypothetical protein
MTLWKWLYNEKKETLYTVGIYKDGTLRNPNGYPEDEVRAACEKAERKSVFATLRDELHNLRLRLTRLLALPRCGTNRLRHVGGVAAPGLGASRLGDRSSGFQIHALGFRLRDVTACPRR